MSLLLLAVVAGCAPRAHEPVVEPVPVPLEVAADSVIPAPEPAVRRVVLPLPPDHAAWIEATIGALSLREKVGQLMIVWTGGQAVPFGSAEFVRLARAVEQDGVGGVIISIGPPQAYVSKLNELQRRARLPLLVMTDMESGPGMRLRGGAPSATNVPHAMALAAAGSDSLAREVGRLTAREARAVGVHMTLAPVLDVNSNPANPIINVRSYGEDPAEVTRYALAFMSGARAEGLLAAAKHFPGHGDTGVDSHIELATVASDRARLEAVELPPFRAAVDDRIDAVLVGHLAVPAIDGSGAGPASLSTRIIGELLRDELGFDGLVITDALNMGGVTRRHGDAELAVRAIEAGADLLLQPRNIPVAVDAVVAAVESGRISEARIDASVRRVLAAKARAGLHERRLVDAGGLAGVVGTRAHANVARSVAERSITLVRDNDDVVPLRPAVRRILSITYADTRDAAVGRVFETELRRSRAVTAVRVHPRTTAREIDALVARAGGFDLVVVSAQVLPREYRGSVDARGGFPELVERLGRARVPLLAVSFGSPYLLSAPSGAPAYLLAWGGSGDSQRAAAAGLLGTLPITGRLPVSLPPEHHAGDGLVRGTGAGTQ
jgi:beta-N-acetylhexosaminidase